MISDGNLTFQKIREVAFKTTDEVLNILKGNKRNKEEAEKKPRGRKGGAVKRSANFKVKDEKEVHYFLNFLLRKFPEIEIKKEENEYKQLENFLMKLKEASVVNTEM